MENMDELKIDEENLEKQYKEALYNSLQIVMEKTNAIKKTLEKIMKKTNIEVEISNIAITINNKLIEMQNQFKEAGISMYTERYDDAKFVGTSLVGDAVINDLIKKFNDGMKILNECQKKMLECLQSKDKKSNLPEKIEKNPLKRFWVKIRKLLMKNKKNKATLLSLEDEETLKSYLEKYEQLNSKVYDFPVGRYNAR